MAGPEGRQLGPRDMQGEGPPAAGSGRHGAGRREGFELGSFDVARLHYLLASRGGTYCVFLATLLNAGASGRSDPCPSATDVSRAHYEVIVD